jgi:hypothetical protein
MGAHLLSDIGNGGDIGSFLVMQILHPPTITFSVGVGEITAYNRALMTTEIQPLY